MTQLTVNLDDDLLQQARETTVRGHTSIHAPAHVQRQAPRLAALAALDAIAERQRPSVVESRTREESHQRTAS